MTTVSSMFDFPSTRGLVNEVSPLLISDGMVGVEVELEGVHFSHELLRSLADSRWKIVEDGSLRNGGVEFVFGQPMYGVDVVETIQNLNEVLNTLEVVPLLSERTSVHVHLDVRDLDYHQILNMVVVYLLCEPYFFEVGGRERELNPYTTPLARSTPYLNRISRALRGSDSQSFTNNVTPEVKYSAFNLAPIATQGSIEFRHHRGEYRPEVILNWVNMVLAVKRYVVNLGDQRMTPEFIDTIVNGGYEEFLDTMFEGVRVPRNVDGWEGAARVSKRMSTLAINPSDSPLLPSSNKVITNRFFRARGNVVDHEPDDKTHLVQVVKAVFNDEGAEVEEVAITETPHVWASLDEIVAARTRLRAGRVAPNLGGI